MCSLHYGFVWIFEPMGGALFVQLYLKTISALPGFCTVSFLIKNIKIKMILLS